MHWDLWGTLTGNDNSPSAGSRPVPTVGGRRAPCLSAVRDPHYSFVTVHLAILAWDTVGIADAVNVDDVFVDEGVEAFALGGSHLPSLHHHVAVVVTAACPLRVHMLSNEPLVHSNLAIGGLYEP